MHPNGTISNEAAVEIIQAKSDVMKAVKKLQHLQERSDLGGVAGIKLQELKDGLQAAMTRFERTTEVPVCFTMGAGKHHKVLVFNPRLAELNVMTSVGVVAMELSASDIAKISGIIDGPIHDLVKTANQPETNLVRKLCYLHGRILI